MDAGAFPLGREGRGHPPVPLGPPGVQGEGDGNLAGSQEVLMEESLARRVGAPREGPFRPESNPPEARRRRWQRRDTVRSTWGIGWGDEARSTWGPGALGGAASSEGSIPKSLLVPLCPTCHPHRSYIADIATIRHRYVRRRCCIQVAAISQKTDVLFFSPVANIDVATTAKPPPCLYVNPYIPRFIAYVKNTATSTSKTYDACARSPVIATAPRVLSLLSRRYRYGCQCYVTETAA